MRPISKVILHCAATRPDDDIGADEIRRWHLARGWSDIGYHAVIRRDGTVEGGRPSTKIGAHVRGHNKGSFGLCLVGGHGACADDGFEEHFTPQQSVALIGMLRGLRLTLPKLEIHGHNEFAAKGCPGFRVDAWLAGVGL